MKQEEGDAEYFYPRPPRGGRQNQIARKEHAMQFLSTPSARRATGRFELVSTSLVISIHALREEGDLERWWRWPTAKTISIHALREEGDFHQCRSTTLDEYFYPRPPRGGRHGRHLAAGHLPDFYPRPPRGGRHGTRTEKMWSSRFLSTPSARRATRRVSGVQVRELISIHALREEGDHCDATLGKGYEVFLSTPSARRATKAPPQR